MKKPATECIGGALWISSFHLIFQTVLPGDAGTTNTDGHGLHPDHILRVGTSGTLYSTLHACAFPQNTLESNFGADSSNVDRAFRRQGDHDTMLPKSSDAQLRLSRAGAGLLQASNAAAHLRTRPKAAIFRPERLQPQPAHCAHEAGPSPCRTA